jgi:hypothetical protein
MFIGEPQFIYIDRSQTYDINANDRKLIGYINLTARCNAPTAFSPAISTTIINPTYTQTFPVFNNGDNKVFPSLLIKMANTVVSSPDQYVIVRIENTTNNTSIEFVKVYQNEEITVDMSIRRISSKDGITIHNIYES